MTIRQQRSHGYYEVRQRVKQRKRKQRVAVIWYFLAAFVFVALWFIFGSGLFVVTQ
jgi:hypothetical protein